MASTSTPRGHELTGGPRALRSGPAWLARLIGGRADALLDRIDLGLDQGSIEVTLPDGTRRLLGGRAPGFAAQARLNSWRALLRVATAGSVGLYQGWEAGDWESPDPVPLFALFMLNADSLDTEVVRDTLNVLLKFEGDMSSAGKLVGEMTHQALREAQGMAAQVAARRAAGFSAIRAILRAAASS